MIELSYCVNCGVELDKGVKNCPLCSTRVINPRDNGAQEHHVPTYPKAIVIPSGVKKKYIIFIASMVLLIPNIIIAVSGILFIDGNWPCYVNASSLLFWVFFIFPFMWKKPLPYVLLLIDSISMGAYLYYFYHSFKANGWFSELAVPIILVLTAIVAVMIKWFKKRREWPAVVTAMLEAVSAVSIFVDVQASLFYYNDLSGAGVSLIISACCLSLCIFFIVVAKSRRFRAWVSRRFFA